MAKVEAGAAFKNDGIYMEKFVEEPRHIEIQVLGDNYGNVIHLGERECSVQRRHQKLIEESPSPAVSYELRQEMGKVAVEACKRIGYSNAGTIEFLMDENGKFYFMEMNTRLQVEHPVTEAITGLDLVELQLKVAAGEPLGFTQADVTATGHAVEARLYAEDPEKGFLPSTGKLWALQFPEGDGIRIDTGVEAGDTVTPFYDPMIAKVIAHGGTRAEAIARLAAMLRGTAVWPVRTNAAFLVKALAHPDFAAGTVDTGLIGRDGGALAEPPAPSDRVLTGAAMKLVQRGLVPGFRLNAAPRTRAPFRLDGDTVEVPLSGEGTDAPAETALLTENGQTWQLSRWRQDATHGATAGDGAILAPMPGKVIAVEVNEGQAVTRGQKLLTLEAMKMEHTLTAPFDGTVAELKVVAGAQVQVEALLVRIAASED